MATRAQFAPDEWTTLCSVPQIVALAVSMAGASGVTGTLKEAFSSSAGLVEGMKSESELIRSICAREEIQAAQTAVRASLPKLEGGDFEALQRHLVELALARTRDAIAVLHRVSPADVPAYRSFVKGLGERVAQAAKEGGFLGFGGERVSEGEKRALAGLEQALGGATA